MTSPICPCCLGAWPCLSRAAPNLPGVAGTMLQSPGQTPGSQEQRSVCHAPHPPRGGLLAGPSSIWHSLGQQPGMSEGRVLAASQGPPGVPCLSISRLVPNRFTYASRVQICLPDTSASPMHRDPSALPIQNLEKHRKQHQHPHKHASQWPHLGASAVVAMQASCVRIAPSVPQLKHLMPLGKMIL